MDALVATASTLTPAEARLGKFAFACAALYAGAGLFFAVLPALTVQLAAHAQVPAPLGPVGHFWHALAVSMMATIATCCALCARAPRERGVLLVPVMVSKATSSLVGLLAFALAPAGALSQGPLWLAVPAIATTDLPLLAATWWFARAAKASAASAR